MNIQDFVRPVEKVIRGKTYLLSHIPALDAQPIYTDIVKTTAGYGDLGMTMLPTETTMALMKYCAVKAEDGGWIPIERNEDVNIHFADLADLIAVRVKLIDLNFGFLSDGSLRELLGAPEADREANK